MAIYYLGTFPPEYGGVTVKNQNLFNALSNKIKIDKVDFSEIKRKNLKETFKLVKVLINRKNIFVIGVTGKNTRKRFCKLLFYVNRLAMNRSVIFLMGGMVAKDIAADDEYEKYMRSFKRIYVEAGDMKKTLDKKGFNNVDIYPNGRFHPKRSYKKTINGTGKLKCVFFSLIQPEKGVDWIINAAKKIQSVDFYLYGKIDETYKKEFEKQIENLNNLVYMGIFKGENEEVYSELSGYDVLLLPTRWRNEGIPGVLIESKIANIPAIVTDHNFNKEIIRDHVDGIVLKNNTEQEFCDAILELDKDRNLLKRYAEEAGKSAKEFYIEKYIDDIAKELKL